jgi:phosphatidylinositol alpha-mannosyltransferase
MKVGIVVPFSWSFWGAVLELAELQLEALQQRGHEVRMIIGNDPPGTFTRALHPRHGRHGSPPPEVIPIGRTVIVPANGSLPNIVLSPSVPSKLKRVFAEERFDVLHVHEPLTPALCVSAVALAPCPLVGTWHAAGRLLWNAFGRPLWGFLVDRIDHRIAVSEEAKRSAQQWYPVDFEVIPNGVLVPPAADPAGRQETIVFIGRHDPRKGLPVMLRAWPDVRRRTGARLRLVGADPLAVRLLLARTGVSDDGIDILGFVPQDELTRELLAAKALAAPSIGMESFGLVLTRAFACAVPVVASAIPGYQAVMTDRTGTLVPPGDPRALADALVELLADEPRRQALGADARALAVDRYGWGAIAERLEQIYEDLAA